MRVFPFIWVSFLPYEGLSFHMRGFPFIWGSFLSYEGLSFHIRSFLSYKGFSFHPTSPTRDIRLHCKRPSWVYGIHDIHQRCIHAFCLLLWRPFRTCVLSHFMYHNHIRCRPYTQKGLSAWEWSIMSRYIFELCQNSNKGLWEGQSRLRVGPSRNIP